MSASSDLAHRLHLPTTRTPSRRPFISHSKPFIRFPESLPSRSSLHAVAVGAGADLVGDVDPALAGDGGHDPKVDARDAAGGRLKALAGGLAVRGGPGGVVQRPDPVAAPGRHGAPAAPGVGDARGQGARHLAARHGGLGHGGRRHHAQEGHARQLRKPGARHVSRNSKMSLPKSGEEC